MLAESGSSQCAAHAQARAAKAEAQRPSANQRGYTSKWAKASAAFLAEHPYCADGCGGRSEVVDHIVPHRGDPKLFWDQSNWQAMTKSHHDAKTARENGGFGNAVRVGLT